MSQVIDVPSDEETCHRAFPWPWTGLSLGLVSLGFHFYALFNLQSNWWAGVDPSDPASSIQVSYGWASSEFGDLLGIIIASHILLQFCISSCIIAAIFQHPSPLALKEWYRRFYYSTAYYLLVAFLALILFSQDLMVRIQRLHYDVYPQSAFLAFMVAYLCQALHLTILKP